MQSNRLCPDAAIDNMKKCLRYFGDCVINLYYVLPRHILRECLPYPCTASHMQQCDHLAWTPIVFGTYDVHILRFILEKIGVTRTSDFMS